MQKVGSKEGGNKCYLKTGAKAEGLSSQKCLQNCIQIINEFDKTGFREMLCIFRGSCMVSNDWRENFDEKISSCDHEGHFSAVLSIQ